MHRHILSDEFLSLEGVMEVEHVEVWGVVWREIPTVCGVGFLLQESLGPAVDGGLFMLGW